MLFKWLGLTCMASYDVDLGACPQGVRRNIAESMPIAQHSLPGLLAGSFLLGMHKQKSMAYFCCHIQRHFEVMQVLHDRFSFYSDKKIYVLNGASQSWGDEHSSHSAVPELAVNVHLPYWKAKRVGASNQVCCDHTAYHFKKCSLSKKVSNTQ